MKERELNWQLLEETKHVSIWLDKNYSLFMHQWRNYNKTMGVNFEIFMENAQIVARHQIAHRPKSVIVDVTELNVTFGGGNIQQWAGFHIEGAMHEAGSDYLAFIKSKDTFTQISIEQLLEEAKDPKFKLRFFKTVERALDWLDI